MARRAHRSSILSSSRTPDQLRVPRSEHLVHFSRRRCFEHNQRPEHLTCRRPRLDVARRAHPWPGTWCTYRRSQYERYSLAVTSDGKVGPSGVVLRPPHEAKCDNVVEQRRREPPARKQGRGENGGCYYSDRRLSLRHVQRTPHLVYHCAGTEAGQLIHYPVVQALL